MRTVGDVETSVLSQWIEPFGLAIAVGPTNAAIPGSYWGAPEAGIIGTTLHVSRETPIHSLLHETSHVLMCDPALRATLRTDAGGTDPEEEAVCALQLALADALPRYSAADCLADMDAWGYSFRQGTAASWYREDAPSAAALWPDYVRALVARIKGLGSVRANC
ncbi:MAG: hypothetical protein AAGH76_17705 [Pseudomonadota bacterium]